MLSDSDLSEIQEFTKVAMQVLAGLSSQCRSDPESSRRVMNSGISEDLRQIRESVDSILGGKTSRFGNVQQR